MSEKKIVILARIGIVVGALSAAVSLALMIADVISQI